MPSRKPRRMTTCRCCGATADRSRFRGPMFCARCSARKASATSLPARMSCRGSGPSGFSAMCSAFAPRPEPYVALGGAVRVAEDETGVLWRKRWMASDAWAAVEVINATPEPDGSRKHYFLQVPANMQTAREAVAWTYGLRADAYTRLVVR